MSKLATTISAAVRKVKVAAHKAITQVRNQFILLFGRWRMQLGIKAVTEIHKIESRQYLEKEKDSKRIRNYIVLLDKPELCKDGKWRTKEQLFWVNRFNFKRIRRAGWLPPTMHMDALSLRAFYVSSVLRDYRAEYKAREHAINKYIRYLKTKNAIPQ